MPSIAELHPIVVHFVIALFFVGLAFRLASLTGRFAWLRPAGATLMILAALASLLAVESGEQAHGPAERIPGARDMVQEHEEYGEEARNLLLIVAGIELLGVALTRKEQWQRWVHIGSAVTGLYAGYLVYEAGEYGGELVYSYAGGVGTRTGDTTDVRRLLIAGLYHQAQQDRAAGNATGAARLTDELLQRMPGDQSVQLMAIESMLKDRADARGALAALNTLSVPDDNDRLVLRRALLVAEAYRVLDMRDSAFVVLEGLRARFGESRALQDALSRLK